MLDPTYVKRYLLWFSLGLILIFIAAIFIQQHGKTFAEAPKFGSPTVLVTSIPNSKAEPERIRLSAQLTQKIFSNFPEAKVDLDCFIKDKYGFMDTTGKLVIPMCFDKVRPFSNGVAQAEIRLNTIKNHSRTDSRLGYINREGVFIVPPVLRDEQFRYVNWSFSENRLPLSREPNSKFGYIDRTGKFAIEPRFDEAYSFHEGLAGVCWVKGKGESFPDRKCGYIDPTGKAISQPEFLQVRPFQNGFAVAVSPKYKKGDPTWNEYLMGVINRQGQFLVEPELDFVGSTYRDSPSEDEIGQFPDTPFGSGLLRVRIPDSRTPPPRADGDYSTDPFGLGKWGYIRKTGGYAIEPHFWEATDFSADRAVVKIGEDDTGYPTEWRGQWAMIDPTGRIIDTRKTEPEPTLSSIFSGSKYFSQGVIAVRANNRLYGYMDQHGKWVIEPQFKDVRDFSNGLAAVVPGVNGKWGYIDHRGKLVIPAQFDSAEPFGANGLASVQKLLNPETDLRGNWGLINHQGQYLLKPKYAVHISPFINGLAQVFPNDSPAFFITESGKILPYGGASSGVSEGLIDVSIKLPDNFKP